MQTRARGSGSLERAKTSQSGVLSFLESVSCSVSFRRKFRRACRRPISFSRGIVVFRCGARRLEKYPRGGGEKEGGRAGNSAFGGHETITGRSERQKLRTRDANDLRATWTTLLFLLLSLSLFLPLLRFVVRLPALPHATTAHTSRSFGIRETSSRAVIFTRDPGRIAIFISVHGVRASVLISFGRSISTYVPSIYVQGVRDYHRRILWRYTHGKNLSRP